MLFLYVYLLCLLGFAILTQDLGSITISNNSYDKVVEGVRILLNVYNVGPISSKGIFNMN